MILSTFFSEYGKTDKAGKILPVNVLLFLEFSVFGHRCPEVYEVQDPGVQFDVLRSFTAQCACAFLGWREKLS